MVRYNLKNSALYDGLGPRFQKAFEYLRTHDLSGAEGRIELEGSALYVLPQSPALKTWEGTKWEAHRRYADIQVILEGEEIIGYAPLETMECDPYNEEKDFVLCRGEGTPMLYRSGDFAVFFPQDAHKPCVRPENGGETVRKAVVKVLL